MCLKIEWHSEGQGCTELEIIEGSAGQAVEKMDRRTQRESENTWGG